MSSLFGLAIVGVIVFYLMKAAIMVSACAIMIVVCVDVIKRLIQKGRL